MEERSHLIERNRTPAIPSDRRTAGGTLVERIPLAVPIHHPAVFCPMAHEWLKAFKIRLVLGCEAACKNQDQCQNNNSRAGHSCSFDQFRSNRMRSFFSS